MPQFILDECYRTKTPCNIVVTQPRRIAAISIAKRVCQERNWVLGSVVGYQVSLTFNSFMFSNLFEVLFYLLTGWHGETNESVDVSDLFDHRLPAGGFGGQEIALRLHAQSVSFVFYLILRL